MAIDAIKAIQQGRIPKGRGWSKRSAAYAEAAGRATGGRATGGRAAPRLHILLEEPPDLSDRHAFLAWVRRCRAHLAERRPFKIWWGDSLCTVAEFNRRLRAAIDYQINLRGGLLQDPRGPHWRKLEDRYQVQLASDARAVNAHYGRRALLHWLGTPELRRRYAELVER